MSDSGGSDYEDARQHHNNDNEELEDPHPQAHPVLNGEVPPVDQDQNQNGEVEEELVNQDEDVIFEDVNVLPPPPPPVHRRSHSSPPPLPPLADIHNAEPPGLLNNNQFNHMQVILQPRPRPAHARVMVEQILNNLWPVPLVGEGVLMDLDDDVDDDGMDNVEDGYFEEDNGNISDADSSSDSFAEISEADDENNDHDVDFVPGRDNESDDNHPLIPEGDEAEAPPPQEFDPQLPGRHAYLGEGMEELQGRVVFLDEGSTPEIPLIVMEVQLVPGQTLPLTIFHQVFQNAIRRCISNNRIFGIVYNDMESNGSVWKGAFGTLAEIYEFQEESDPDDVNQGNITTFSIKAKGRQRFNVVSFRRQADGNLMGTVKIRPEIILPHPVQGVCLEQTHRYRFPLKRRFEEDEDNGSPESSANKLTKRLSISSATNTKKSFDDGSSLNPVVEGTEEDDLILTRLKKENREQRKATKYYSAFTPFPYFVYEQFQEKVLVEKVHRKLKIELKGVTESGINIPRDASELSFWLAQNLTMDDNHRIKLLKMDSPIQRLRYELELLNRACKVITCRHCQSTVAESSDIFSMSIEGPQGTYVNPHGFVHETLTVHKTKGLQKRGYPSTEASWFPGYAWTIVECFECKSHVGWKFRAVGRLMPRKFWGLARRSISFKYDFNTDQQDELTTQTTNQEQEQVPPTSV